MATESNLSKYPRPSVAVDLAVLTVLPDSTDPETPGTLAVLIQTREPKPSGSGLPGRFLRHNQTFAQAAADIFEHKIGLNREVPELRQLQVFDEPGRDERAWTISLAYAVVLPYPDLAGADGEFVPIDLQGRLVDHAPLLFDHDEIVAKAAANIRDSYESRPDPDHLMGPTFNLTELRLLHEAVLGEKLLHDTFKRRMREQLVEELGEDGKPLRLSSGGRPAQIYRRIADGSEPVTESERRRLQLPRA